MINQCTVERKTMQDPSLQTEQPKIRNTHFPGRRTARRLFIMSMIGLGCALVASCVIKADFSDHSLWQNHYLEGMGLLHPRFEPVTGHAVRPSLTSYWMKNGDSMAVRWQSFDFHWGPADRGPCDYSNRSAPGNDCYICDYCVETHPGSGPPCFGQQLAFNAPDAIVRYESFTEPLGQPITVQGLANSDYNTGCPASSNPVTFPLSHAGLYQLNLPGGWNTTDETYVETQIHLLEPNQTTKLSYPLTRTTYDQTTYWKFVMAGDEDLLENFSPNLKVTDVRVFKGKCVADPNTGECTASMESKPVKPSRLFFIPDLGDSVANSGSEATHRCYAKPDAGEGFFFPMSNCRETYDPNPTIRSKSMTPTFEHGDSGEQLQKLTWLFEFNTFEAGDVDISTPCDPMVSQIGCDQANNSDEFFVEFTITTR